MIVDGCGNHPVDAIYVDDKAAALAAFHRVLKPGGRVSLFEPINRRYIPLNRDTLFGFDAAPIAELVTRGCVRNRRSFRWSDDGL